MKIRNDRMLQVAKRPEFSINSLTTTSFVRLAPFATCLLAAFVSPSGSVMGQQAPDSTVTIEDRIRDFQNEETRRQEFPSSWEIEQIASGLPSQTEPRSIVLEHSQDEETGTSDIDTGELSLTLNAIVLEGSTVYEDGELEALYVDFYGTEIALAEVFRIASRITTKYRNDGYILSRAIVPPQTISDGRVRIQVIEGFINDVKIEGEVGETQLLAAYANKIMNSRPLSTKDMERYLLLIDDLPGISSEAVLSPSKDVPGASDLLINVSGKTVGGYARIDNRGTNFNGPGQLWIGADINSYKKTHHQTSVRLLAAGDDGQELNSIEIDHARQLGTEGQKLHIQLLQSNSKPGYTLSNLNIVSKTRLLRFGWSDPRIRSRSRNLSLHANFVLRDSETTIFGNRLSKDRVRFLSFGATYDSADRFGGINQFEVNLDKGLGLLGASNSSSKNRSRENANFNFTKARLSASRLQRLGNQVSLLGRFRSQVSLDKLPASEEFGVGGESCVRAYDASEISGDHGACLLLELRYGKAPDQGREVGYELYGFFDIGGVWRKHSGALGNKAYLSSTGIGARVNFSKQFSGSLELAWPHNSKVDNRTIDIGSRRASFSITSRF